MARKKLLPGKYAAIGFVASKVVLPIVRRQIRKKARSTATGAASAGANAVMKHPARASVAVGSAVGAVGYLVMRRGRQASDAPAGRASRDE